MQRIYEKPTARNLGESATSFGQLLDCTRGSAATGFCSAGEYALAGCTNGNQNRSGLGCNNGNNNTGYAPSSCVNGNNNETGGCSNGGSVTG